LDREECLERLEGLRHDLGKYLVLPVAMLPAAADRAALATALDEGLHRTRRSAAGTRDARSLWDEFQAAAGAALSRFGAHAQLSLAVERALGWGEALKDPTRPLERAQILRELRAVGEAIDGLAQALRDELAGHGAAERSGDDG
jgi:hypothetical protein